MIPAIALVTPATAAADPTFPTARSIQQAVCLRYGVALADVLSYRRTAAVALPRHVAMWLCRHCTALSLPQIARAFCKQDHTTVIHAVGRIDAMMAADTSFDIEMRALRFALLPVELRT